MEVGLDRLELALFTVGEPNFELTASRRELNRTLFADHSGAGEVVVAVSFNSHLFRCCHACRSQVNRGLFLPVGAELSSICPQLLASVVNFGFCCHGGCGESCAKRYKGAHQSAF